MFLNIRNTGFDQSSPVQPNPKKNSGKIWTKIPFEKNATFLVLTIEEISLWPEFSSPPRFRFQPLLRRQWKKSSGATILIGREIQCLPYEGFFLSNLYGFCESNMRSRKFSQNVGYGPFKGPPSHTLQGKWQKIKPKKIFEKFDSDQTCLWMKSIDTLSKTYCKNNFFVETKKN